jgi:hypothetical protein
LKIRGSWSTLLLFTELYATLRYIPKYVHCVEFSYNPIDTY